MYAKFEKYACFFDKIILIQKCYIVTRILAKQISIYYVREKQLFLTYK